MTQKRCHLVTLVLLGLLLTACAGQSGVAIPTQAQRDTAPTRSKVDLAASPEPHAAAPVSTAGAGEPPQRDYWPTHDWKQSTATQQGMNPALLARAAAAVEQEYPNIYSLLVIRHGYL
jgi:hypothetical protein